MIQDDIEDIEVLINKGDNVVYNDDRKTYYLEAIAKTQLLILREICTV